MVDGLREVSPKHFNNVVSNSFSVRLYYHHDAECLSECPLIVQAFARIIDGIEDAGPVWIHWCFAMECYCGMLQRSVTSWLFPYASLNLRVLELAQLHTIMRNYELQNTLRPPRYQKDSSGLQLKECMSFLIFSVNLLTMASVPHDILLPTRSRMVLDKHLYSHVVAHLFTHFSVT